MKPDAIANVLGAFAQAVTDIVRHAVAEGPGEAQTSAAALVHLSKYPDESIDALRKPLRLSHPGCVRVVDRLQERRLVARGEGADRRARPLRLTPAGQAAARAVLDDRLAALHRALETLTARERQVLGQLVGKVLTGLVHDEAQALAVCRVCDYQSCPNAVCPVAKALSS